MPFPKPGWHRRPLDGSRYPAVFHGLTVLGVLPDRPPFRDYLDRITTRPAFQRRMQRDAG